MHEKLRGWYQCFGQTGEPTAILVVNQILYFEFESPATVRIMPRASV